MVLCLSVLAVEQALQVRALQIEQWEKEMMEARQEEVAFQRQAREGTHRRVLWQPSPRCWSVGDA